MRCLLAAFGDPGHVFPVISLARALQSRGHRVMVESWPQWKGAVEGAGIEFTGADEYQVFPPPPSGSPGAGQAAVAMKPLLDEFNPDVLVNDVLTVAPTLAAEAHGCRRVTLVPHVYPAMANGMPPFAVGALPARTPVGRRFWAAADGLLGRGLRLGRADLNEQRAIAGLAPTDRYYGAISPELALVATYPQLEYPREWPETVEITGPMPFEMPHPDIPLPPGDDPLVLVAPSTSKDPEQRLVRAALEGLGGEPVRIVATTNRAAAHDRIPVPPNGVLVDWLSYAQVMPRAELVICHGGHGTVARALAAGTPILSCPADGDMNETAARITWAGVGLSIRWSLTGPHSLKWAAAEILNDPSYRSKAGRIAAWDTSHDGPARGAGLIEGLVAGS